MKEVSKTYFRFSQYWFKWKWYKIHINHTDFSFGKGYPSFNKWRQLGEKIGKIELLEGLSNNGRVYFERGKDIDIEAMWFSNASDYTLYMMLRG